MSDEEWEYYIDRIAALTAERDEARAFATELQQVMLDPIACDVRLPPATTLRARVSFATLRAAIEQRKGRDNEFALPSAGLLAEERIASLTAELDEARAAIDQFPFRQMENLVNEAARLRAENQTLREALSYLQSYGCPICHGDCASANPPVFCCPMIQASTALSARSDVGHD